MASSSLQSLAICHLQIQKHTARAVDFNFFVFVLKSASVPFFFLADRLLFFLLLGRSASVFFSSLLVAADDWEAAGGCGLMVEIGEL